MAGMLVAVGGLGRWTGVVFIGTIWKKNSDKCLHENVENRNFGVFSFVTTIKTRPTLKF
jgi:hypothetical protein